MSLVQSRNAEEYALSMEVASTETPIALALKVSLHKNACICNHCTAGKLSLSVWHLETSKVATNVVILSKFVLVSILVFRFQLVT